MKVIYGLCIWCMWSAVAQAQMVEVKEKVSGFLGKRLVVGANGYFSISSHPQVADDYESLFSLNKSFQISAQYTISNSKSLGFSIGTSHTSSLLSEYDFNSDVDYKPILATDGKEYYFEDIKGQPDIKDRSICIEYRGFLKKKGAVSPFGAYIAMGLNFHNYEIDASDISIIADRDIDYYTTERKELIVNNPMSKKTVPEFYLGYGIARPIWNSVFLDVGIKSGLLLTSWYTIDGYDTAFDETLEMVIYKRLASKEIINFKIGIQIPIL